MTPENDHGHLSAELMQGFLDGDVSPREAARVEEHTARCARCRSELSAWSELFTELGALGELAPGPTFREGVLGALPAGAPARPGLRARVWQRLRAVLGTAAPAPVPARPWHPASGDFQDFLEGLLGRRQTLAVEGHLHACHACRADVEGWRSLLTNLGRLPTFAPAPEFTERVMAHVRVQLALAAARPTLAERVQLLWRGVSPRTRKRFAALAGAGVAPAVTLVLVAWAVFSHPLVTIGNLVSFLWLLGSDWLGSRGGAGLARLSESTPLLWLQQLVEVFGASPAAAALAVTGLAALTVTAVWVLYRNVLLAPSVSGSYVR